MSFRKLFANRDFSIFFAGQSVSRLGDSIFTLALVWMAHVLTNSTFLMSIVLAAGVVPRIIIAPVTGVLVERWPKRISMLVTDVIRCILVCLLTVMTVWDWVSPIALVVVSFLLAMLSTVATPAFVILQKVIIPKDLLLQANSLNQTVLNITQIAGPAIAGFLIGLGGLSISFGVDAATYLVSAITLLLISVPDEPERSTTPLTTGAVLGDMASGMKIFWSFPAVRALAPPILLYTFAVIAVENLLIVQYVANTLHIRHATEAVGSLNASMAVGELIGSFLITSVTSRFGREKLQVFLMMTSALTVLCIGLTHSVLVIGGLFFVAGFCMSIANVSFFTSIQEAIPNEALGRVWAILGAVFNVVVPLGQLLFGGIAGLVPLGLLISLMGLFGMLAAASAFLNPAIRQSKLIANPPAVEAR